MDYDKLPDPANKELVMKGVDELLVKLSSYTRRQLENALLYCIEGNFDFANEPTPVSNKRTSDIDTDKMVFVLLTTNPLFELHYRLLQSSLTADK